MEVFVVAGDKWKFLGLASHWKCVWLAAAARVVSVSVVQACADKSGVQDAGRCPSFCATETLEGSPEP